MCFEFHSQSVQYLEGKIHLDLSNYLQFMFVGFFGCIFYISKLTSMIVEYSKVFVLLGVTGSSIVSETA